MNNGKFAMQFFPRAVGKLGLIMYNMIIYSDLLKYEITGRYFWTTCAYFFQKSMHAM